MGTIKDNKKGRLIILSSPSGGGKSTICKHLKEKQPELGYSVSTTTRMPRNGEKDGKDYFFVNKKEFKKAVKEGLFAEWAKVHNHYYGTARKVIDDFIKKGKTCLLDIDIQGGLQLMRSYPDAVSIFILPPSFEELERRLRNRKTDSERTIRIRLRNAKKELEYQKFYDHTVVNSILDETINKIVEIINKK
ncbi:MAG: guanylate kinase [Spirochaetes bacterium]|nr:guanylate kinase [Spirochaetota bacterium]